MKKVILLASSLVILVPIALSIMLSMYAYYRYPLLLPNKFTLEFWENTIRNNGLFYSSVGNSLLIGVFNGVLVSLIGLMTARALVKYEFIGRSFMKSLFSLPLFIPSMALFMGAHTMMIKLQLINSFAGVVLAHMLISIPYATSIFIALLQGIHPDIENAARTLGCKQTMIYTKVLLPLLAPGIVLSFAVGFLISFSEYFSTFLIGGGKVLTLATILYPYITNRDTGNAAVLGIIFISVNMLLLFIADYLYRKKRKISTYLYE